MVHDVDEKVAVSPEEKRTIFSLSLTMSDKKTLKLMAAERNTTIAAIIHEWIVEHSKEVE